MVVVGLLSGMRARAACNTGRIGGGRRRAMGIEVLAVALMCVDGGRVKATVVKLSACEDTGCGEGGEARAKGQMTERPLGGGLMRHSVAVASHEAAV